MRPIRVMTFNLRVDTPADGARAWAHRRAAVAEVVRSVAPHVLATQEGLAHQVRDVERALGGYARVGQGRRGGARDEHCALWFDESRFALESSGDFWLSDAPDEPGSASWGNDLPRMATWARLKDRETGRVATFASTHLDHRSSLSRAKSADLLAARLPGAVVAGDFNALPWGPVAGTMARAGWTDAAGSALAPGTFHAFTGRARARIDWILAPRGARTREHRVVTEQPLGHWPSDHFPVVAEVALA